MVFLKKKPNQTYVRRCLTMENVTVLGGTLDRKEIDEYIKYVREKNDNRQIESLQIEVDGDYVNLSYKLEPQPFDRIRRITGYLVGTTDRFNNAKRAEERDRVKHTLTL